MNVRLNKWTSISLFIMFSCFQLLTISSVWADDVNVKPAIPSSSVLSFLGLGNKKANAVATKLVTLHEPFQVEGLAFSPDGKYLATTQIGLYLDESGKNREVHIWDWHNQKLIKILQKLEFSGALTSYGLQWSPDGRFLAVIIDDGIKTHTMVRVWDTRNWLVVSDIIGVGGSSSIIFTHDSRYLLRALEGGGTSNDALIAYDTQTWQKMWELDSRGFQEGKIFHASTLAISPNGKQLAMQGEQFVPDSTR